MHFLDLKTQYERIAPKIHARIHAVLAHGQFVMGPEITELENRLASYAGVKHAIAVSSGTAALQVALMALGVKAGDEVIIPGFSFFATAEVVLLLGAKPVMVDIDPRTYNIDAAQIEAAITPRTRVIIPVSLYGQPADMNAIAGIAAQHGLEVLEDAAQSFGARYHGKRSCALSKVAATSFFPAKPLGGYGDGGALFTDDDDLAVLMRSVASHGEQGRYHHVHLGLNARMSTIQAAVLLEKLAIFDGELQARQRVAAWYQQALLPVRDRLACPFIAEGIESAYAQYTVRLEARDELRKQCMNQGIPTAIHYPVGMHQQPAYQKHYPKENNCLPEVEAAAHNVLSLPCHPYLEQHEVEQVAEVIQSVLLGCALA
jgi:UDP-2-acetamido-2-deoxy-ribo-hexuluronate aminotransferase